MYVVTIMNNETMPILSMNHKNTKKINVIYKISLDKNKSDLNY